MYNKFWNKFWTSSTSSGLVPSRLEVLRRAGSVFPCVCNGRWIPGALRVLDLNCEAVDGFCYDVRKALEMGAKRGANFALIGQPGCGKSMMFEPFDDIYTVMGKPEDRSSFP